MVSRKLRDPDTATFAVLDIVRKLPEAYRETLPMHLADGRARGRPAVISAPPRRRP